MNYPPLGKFKVQSKKCKVKSIASGQTLNPRPATLVPFLYFELFTFDLLQQVTLETEEWEGCSLGQPDIGYHYYRRVADDDPIMNPANSQEGNPDRNISISFRQPPILKDGLPIWRYRVGDATFDPLHTSYLIEEFKAEDYPGQDVIEGVIVNSNAALNEEKKYNLEARTYVDDNTWSAPSVFTVIVKPSNP